MGIQSLITDNLNIWSTALDEKKSGRGRGSNNKDKIYGVKKLRELILDLAVRGKLVPQDPNDEPASELMKRIEIEKQELIKQGKIKKEKPLNPITDDEKPFEIPKRWEWVRINEIANVYNGNSISENLKLSKYTGLIDGLPFIATKDVGYGDKCLDYINGVKIPINEEKFKVAPSNTVLICAEGGSAGRKIGITNQEICFGNKLFANVFYGEVLPLFVFYTYQSNLFFNAFSKRMSGIIGGISLNQFLSITIPIPPVLEQHRIVAKVDELMKLCDDIEAGIIKSFDVHEKLVETLLNNLTTSKNNDDFNSTWQVIYNNFETLFTTEESIEKLKQTILQLAIMGKLFPQDPNEEPASELLKRIQDEKQKLISEGKIKKEKPLPPITDDDKPFDLPNGWEWVRLGSLLTKIGAGSTPLGGKQVYLNKGIPFLRSQNVWDEGLNLDDVAYISNETHEKMSGTHVQGNDLLFNITGGSIGRCAVVPPDFITGNVSQHVTIIRLLRKGLLPFIHYVLISEYVQKTVMDVQVGVSREGLSISKLSLFLVPMPPLDEQKRIVDTITELMGFCDKLKSKIAASNKTQISLADSICKI